MSFDPHDPAVRAAQLLADHAALAYAAGVLLTALVALFGWRLLRRVAPSHGPGAAPVPRALLWRLGIGFASIGMAGLLFAETVETLGAEPEALGRFDEALAARLADVLPAATLQVFALLTHLGDFWFLTGLVLVVAAWLLRARRHRMAFAWLAGCAGGGLLNRWLKALFERVRPPHDHGFAVADGFSFPSGHSAGAVVVYGLLTYLLLQRLPPEKHPAVVAAAAALVFTVGVSRVLLQVHWASDVIAGWASGGAWLLACVLSLVWLRHRRDARHTAASANDDEGTR